MRDDGISGPVPPPQVLAEYAKIDPSFPEGIFKMAEENNAARIALHTQGQAAEIAERRRGQSIGGGIAVGGFMTTCVLGYWDLEAAAAIVGGSTLVSLVSAFVLGRTARPAARDSQRIQPPEE